MNIWRVFNPASLNIPSVIILTLFMTSFPVQADDSTDPFESLSFRLQGVVNTNKNDFRQYWDSQYGADLSIEMPFYYGLIQGGLLLYQFDGKDNKYPDFLSTYIYLGWGATVRIIDRLRWYNGFQAGSYIMFFDDEEQYPTQKRESELGFGLNTRLILDISSGFHVQAGLGYLRVLTHRRLDFTMISLGFSYTIESPQWLKEFLE